MIQSIINFERKLISNFHKIKQISIIDGENFKFLPYTTKCDFLDHYSRISTLFFVSKSNNNNECFNSVNNINNIYFLKILPVKNLLKKKYCSDDSFCIYMANFLLLNNKNFVLFSNDKYRDIKSIKNQEISTLEFKNDKYIFNPKSSLKNLDYNLIKDYKQNFY